jgi:hypothetical protein
MPSVGGIELVVTRHDFIADARQIGKRIEPLDFHSFDLVAGDGHGLAFDKWSSGLHVLDPRQRLPDVFILIGHVTAKNTNANMRRETDQIAAQFTFEAVENGVGNDQRRGAHSHTPYCDSCHEGEKTTEVPFAQIPQGYEEFERHPVSHLEDQVGIEATAFPNCRR